MQSISTIGLDIAKSVFKCVALMRPAKWSYAGSWAGPSVDHPADWAGGEAATVWAIAPPVHMIALLSSGGSSRDRREIAIAS